MKIQALVPELFHLKEAGQKRDKSEATALRAWPKNLRNGHLKVSISNGWTLILILKAYQRIDLWLGMFNSKKSHFWCTTVVTGARKVAKI